MLRDQNFIYDIIDILHIVTKGTDSGLKIKVSVMVKLHKDVKDDDLFKMRVVIILQFFDMVFTYKFHVFSCRDFILCKK